MIEDKSIGKHIFDVLNAFLLILTAAICIVPIWHILCVSFSAKEAVDAGQVVFWPMGFNALSYRKILGEFAFFNSFFISVKRVALGTAISLAAILLAAYPLSKSSRQFPRRNIYMWVLIFCMLFNGGTVPWYLTIRSYHLINSIWALVLAGGLPVFNLILVINFFKNLPPALEEAAYVDGAGPWQILFKIYIPISGPVIATVALFTIVGYWNEFFQGLVLTTRQAYYPLQTYIQQLVVSQDLSTMNTEQIREMALLNDKSLNAAKVFIAMIPVLMIYPFLQRYFVTGIMLGSVKE